MKLISKQSFISATLTLGATSIASCIQLNYMFGTLYSFFSASQITIPLAGAFGGSLASLMLYFVQSIMYGFTHSGSILFLYHLPTLCAGLYLSQTQPRFLKIVLPILCMALFVCHPVGRLAAPYALYWFIPVIISLSHTQMLFVRALGATFTAHAVGSTIFLYTKVTDPSLWYTLMPIVPLERLVFATGISMTCMAVIALAQAYKNVRIGMLRKAHE